MRFTYSDPEHTRPKRTLISSKLNPKHELESANFQFRPCSYAPKETGPLMTSLSGSWGSSGPRK